MLPKNKRHWAWKAEWIGPGGLTRAEATGHWEGASLSQEEVLDAVHAHLAEEQGSDRIWVHYVKRTALGQRLAEENSRAS